MASAAAEAAAVNTPSGSSSGPVPIPEDRSAASAQDPLRKDVVRSPFGQIVPEFLRIDGQESLRALVVSVLISGVQIDHSMRGILLGAF